MTCAVAAVILGALAAAAGALVGHIFTLKLQHGGGE